MKKLKLINLILNIIEHDLESARYPTRPIEEDGSETLISGLWLAASGCN